MTEQLWIVALVLYGIAYYYGRALQRVATERLEPEVRRRLETERPNASPAVTFAVFAVGILTYVLARKLAPSSWWPGVLFAGALLAAYVAFTARFVARLRALEMPGYLIRAVLFGRGAQLAALVTLIVVLVARS